MSLTRSDFSAWRVFLNHFQALDQHVVCKLLCTSAALWDLVQDACAGRLCISVQPTGSSTAALKRCFHRSLQTSHVDATAVSKWLLKHHQLVSAAVMRSSTDGLNRCAVQQTGTCGRSPTSPACGNLQHYIARVTAMFGARQPPHPTAVLNNLSAASHLTRLEWQVSSGHGAKQCSKALRSLQALRSLDLLCVDSGTGKAMFAALAPAVQALTKLSKLQLQHWTLNKASTQQLPPSLRNLTIGPPLPRVAVQAMREQQLLLAHLTQLTLLQTCVLKGSDVLPVQLKELRVGLLSVLALMPLRQLRLLTVTEGIPEAVLSQLHSLSHLQTVSLSCRCLSSPAAASSDQTTAEPPEQGKSSSQPQTLSASAPRPLMLPA